jgi:hypothetical protein
MDSEIQSLAQAELEAADTDQSTASARRFVKEPPDLDNIKDVREARRQYAQWIEGRREARERQRFARQEDEVWGLAKAYVIISCTLIALAFFLAR